MQSVINNINARIKLVRKRAGLTQQQFADNLGISRSYVSEMEAGQKQPSFHLLKLIVAYYATNIHWLQTGEGEMLLPKEVSETLEDDRYRKIGIYYAAGAGSPAFLIEGEPIDELWLRKDLLGEGIVVVKVRGSSMAPTIVDGAYVGVDTRDRRIVSGELYAVWVNGEGALIKRLTIEPGDKVHILSDNPDSKRYPTWVREFKDLSDAFIQGRVRWIMQKL